MKSLDNLLKRTWFLKIVLLLFTLNFFTIFSSYSQKDSLKNPIYLDKIRGEFITVDSQGNVYVVQDSYLYKYSLTGQFQYSYTNFALGSITTVDVSNLSKIMLFFKESGVLIFLNEQLSAITEKMDLTALNFNTISLAAFSTTNSIWLYDYANTDLISLDFYMNLKNKVHYSFDNFQPIQMTVINEKQIAIFNPETGIRFFDSFGTFIKSIAVTSDKHIQITDSFIYYIKGNILHCYNYHKLDEYTVELPMNNIKQCLVYRDKYILLTEDGKVIIY
jgi:hypothetical protein